MDGRRKDREAAERLGHNLWRARRAGFSQEELGALCSLRCTEWSPPGPGGSSTHRQLPSAA